MTDITISAEPPKPISVELVGETYTVRPLKASLGIALSQKLQAMGEDPAKIQKTLTELVVAIFGKTDGAKVTKRFQDADDALDFEHLISLVNALVTRSTGNPTM